jgi:peptidoglycan/LPS O-acetylase OafA/YrhL
MTGLRGLAAAMVAIYHLNPETISGSGLGRFVGKGYLWVDLFFILSGFVLALNYAPAFSRGWSAAACVDFLIRRVARLYPLYATVVFVGLACMVVGGGQSPAPTLVALPTFHRPLVDSAANILMVQAWGIGPSIDGTTWSLSTEWAAYLLFPPLVALVLFSRRLTAAAVGLALAALAAGTVTMTAADGAYHSGPLDAYDGATLAPILRCLTGFTLGLLTFRATRLQWLVDGVTHDGRLGAVLVLLLVIISADAHDLFVYPVFAALVLGLHANRSRIGQALGSKPLHWLGTVSYSVYLLHPLLVLPRRQLDAVLHGWLDPSRAYWASSLVVYVALFVAAGASYRMIEEPGRRSIIRLARKTPISFWCRPSRSCSYCAGQPRYPG